MGYSHFFLLFCLAVGIFPDLCFPYPQQSIFYCFGAWLWVFSCLLFSHTHSSLFFIAFLLGCGYFSCLLFSHTHSSLFFIAFLLGCGYFSCLMLSIPMTIYFLLLFCLAVGIFLDLCFPYPHFSFTYFLTAAVQVLSPQT